MSGGDYYGDNKGGKSDLPLLLHYDSYIYDYLFMMFFSVYC